jgi:hypothetical protein
MLHRNPQMNLNRVHLHPVRMHVHFCLEKLHPVPTHPVRVHPAILSQEFHRQ